MNKNRQRKLAARTNRQESRNARYGTAIDFPQPTDFPEKEEEIVVVKRSPGRPPKSSLPTQQGNKKVLLKRRGGK